MVQHIPNFQNRQIPSSMYLTIYIVQIAQPSPQARFKSNNRFSYYYLPMPTSVFEGGRCYPLKIHYFKLIFHIEFIVSH